MLKFIAISILFMIVESMIADKIEALLDEKNNGKEQEQEYDADIETLKILSDYGLINRESYNCGANRFDEV